MEIVFVPGLGEDASAFAHQEKHLELNATTFDYDAFATTDQMVDALVESMPPECILIGHSLGGYLAMSASAKKPPQKLILLNTWANDTAKLKEQNKMAMHAIENLGLDVMLKAQIPLLMHPERAKDTALLDQTYEMLSKKPPETFIRLFQAIDKASDLTSLSTIPSETLVIHGREDPLFSLTQHQFIASQIPRAKLALIEECGHNSPIEQPVAATALIKFFIEASLPNR